MRTKSVTTLIVIFVSLIFALGCASGGVLVSRATPTPTRTPKPTFTLTPTHTPQPPPTQTPVPTDTPEVPPTATPAPPTATPEVPPTDTPQPPTDTPAPTDTPQPRPPTDTPTPVPPTDTPQPSFDFVIANLRILKPEENSGGTGAGGAHVVFLKVVDASGAPLDGVVMKELTTGDSGHTNSDLVSGSKGPGQAEYLMWGDVYRIQVIGDKSGKTYTGETTHRLSLVDPVLEDLVAAGYCPDVAACATHPWHWSYEVVFQRTW